MDYEVTITTGSGNLLTHDVRAEYEELLDLLRQNGIEGKVAAEHRDVEGFGGTGWIDLTVILLATPVTTWAIQKALDAMSKGAKQWMQHNRRRRVEENDPDFPARPQSVIIKSDVTGEPVRRIDIDSDGNVTEYGWVEINNEVDSG
jgi:hypothetical protein